MGLLVFSTNGISIVTFLTTQKLMRFTTEAENGEERSQKDVNVELLEGYFSSLRDFGPGLPFLSMTGRKWLDVKPLRAMYSISLWQKSLAWAISVTKPT